MKNNCTAKYTAIYILSTLLLAINSTPLFADAICQLETLENSAQRLKQEGWEEHFKDDEITVYNRTASDSDIREVLATTVFTIPAKDIFNTLSDYPKYVEFMPYIEKSTVIKQNENSTTLFQLLNFPLPISDRYFVIELTSITDSNKNHKISWTLASEVNTPQAESGIALIKDDGYWKLCSIQSNNSTYIEYFIHTDPGGIIPTWIVNQVNSQAVPDVLRALNERTIEINRTQTADTEND
ncbi:SRPBCC family protein [Pseudomonadota bacterium]